MRFGKKLASALMAFILTIGLCPAPAFATSGAASLTAGSALTIQDESDTNGNPYPKYNYTEGVDISCTWYAWDQVYSKLGISLPKWGNGGDWYDAANADPSYEVGSMPLPNSLAIYNGYDEWGHVEYVTAVNGTNITVNTGGWYGDGWRDTHATKEGLVKSGIVGQGNLRGYVYLVQENPMTVTGASMSLAASAVKSAAKKVSPFAVVGAVGAVSFSNADSSKNLAITSDGTVTVKKGTPTGIYTVKVAVKATGDSRYKEKAVTAEAKVQVVSPPAAPNALTFKTSPLMAGFKASWSKAKRADGYEIAYASAKDKAKGWQATVLGNVSSARVTGLKQSALYTVKIRSFAKAVDGKKYYSDWGAVSNVKTESSACKIVFKANGGKGSMRTQTIDRDKSTALSANKFTRSGYKFSGWNTKANGKGKAYENKQKAKNPARAGGTVTLYAQWKKKNAAKVDVVDFTSYSNGVAAVKEDGSLWIRGSRENFYGFCNSASQKAWMDTGKSIKIMTGVKSFSSHNRVCAIIKKDNSLWMWGGSIGTTKPKRMLANVDSISLGDIHYAAVKKDGSLWTWGDNWYGNLGDGTYTDRSVPTKVMTGVKSVAVGDSHMLIVKKDGSLWSCGDNRAGQLGRTTSSQRVAQPGKVADNVVKASAAYFYSVYVTSDGQLWGMGYNGDWNLGISYPKETYKPLTVPGGTGVVDVATYHRTTIIMKNDNSMWACGQVRLPGEKYTSSVGDYKLRCLSLAKNGVKRIDKGGQYLYQQINGGIWGWGRNGDKQLTDKTFWDVEIPVKVAF